MRAVAKSRDWNLVWDIGANNGRYSRIAAEGAKTVMAVDADQGPVELLYRDLRGEGNEQILPLTMNLADPSPGLGWRGLERRSMPERGKPDLMLALALVHHMAISANVPVKEFIDWLAWLGGELVIEFPTREDPMVRSCSRPSARACTPTTSWTTSSARSRRRSTSSAPSGSSRARGCCTTRAPSAR